MRTSLALLASAIVSLACQPTAQQTNPASGAPSTTADPDPDIAAVGATGLPAGYRGVADRPNANLADARYAATAAGWEITTGPAHILFRPGDVASGNYTITTTVDQLARPRHPESFGVLFGGRDLEAASRSYNYFLVRGTGEFSLRHRQGDSVHTVLPWQRSELVPAADTAGRATYRLQVRVASDSVRFRVNDRQVAAVARSNLQTDGIVGLRINHNLSLRATPVVISRD